MEKIYDNKFKQWLYEKSYRFFKTMFKYLDKDDRWLIYNISLIFFAINIYVILYWDYNYTNVIWVILLLIWIILTNK